MRLPLILAASLVSLPAFAQIAPPPGQNPTGAQPTPPTIEQQANADMASITLSDLKTKAIEQNWHDGLITLGTQRDNLKAQVDVQEKQIATLTDWMNKAKKVYPDIVQKITDADKAPEPPK